MVHGSKEEAKLNCENFIRIYEQMKYASINVIHLERINEEYVDFYKKQIK